MLEIDEYAHVDRKLEYKKSRQLMVEKKTGHTFLKFNPVAVDFTNYRVMNQVCMHIKQSTIESTKKSTKKSLIDDLWRNLLEAAIGLKSNCKKEVSKLIEKIVKNVLPEYKKWLVCNMQ